MGKIIRKKKLQIFVGDVAIGGSAPISVQSMTNTNTEDVDATVNQINACAKAGADIMRVSVPSIEAAYSFGKIKSLVNIPLIADIHFDYKIALEVANQGADCLRINPGNIGNSDRIAAVVQCAKDHNIPIRIGINAGSLEKDLQLKYKEPTADALVESAFRQIELLNKFDFNNFKISLKASDVLMATEAYQTISTQIDNPLHLGITEAGTMRSGTVKSAIGIGSLLMQGIGDTLRVSLAEDPVVEVKVAWDILKSLHLRSRGVRLIACPSCSRQNFDVIKTANALDAALEDVEESIDVAVIGCIVNGPGEAKIADVGLTGGSPNHLIYVDGKVAEKTASVDLVGQLETIIRNKIANKAKLIASSSN